MPGRHGEQLILLKKDAAAGEVRFMSAEDGHCGEHHVEFAAAEGTEARAELLLVELDLAVGVLGPEGRTHLEDEPGGAGADEPHPQCPADAAAGRRRLFDGVVDLLVGGPQLVVEGQEDLDVSLLHGRSYATQLVREPVG
jgi:hypothetical protein